MARDDLRVTIQPTITDYYSNWQYDSNDTILRLSGSWQPSQSYTVTISGQSRDRNGEALAKDTVVRFTTAPLEPQMWLNIAGPMGLYDVDGPQTIYATCINVERVDFSLFRVDRASFLSLINRNKDKSGGGYTPASSSLVRSWSQAVSSPLNASSLVSTTLSSAGPLQPGVYYLQAGSPNVTNKAGYLLVATRYNLLLKHTDKEALLWVTSLATGKPVAGAALTLLDTSSNVIATGASDADGLFRTPIQLTNPYDSVYAVVESDGQVVAAVGSDWANGINPWDFNLSASRGSVPYYGQMDTDRAIYRPGQSVFYKGILRADDDAVYSLPNLDSVIVEARDVQGRQVFSSTMPLSPFGTFNGEIKLAEGAGTGGYFLSVKTGNQADDRIYASMTFQVAEYRRPEFQVAVSLDKPEYVNGDTISATATASYFFGGAVADAAVTWRLMSEDYFFSSDLIKGYWDFSDWDYTVGRRAQGKVLSEGKGKTDKQGGFSFSVPADLSEFPQSQSFTLEADVTDINNQAVASRTTVIVHKGQVYIGLRPQRYVGSAGDEQAVDVISVDTKGITVTNQAVTVSFYQREWYSARVKQTDGSFVWQSAYTDTFAFKDEVKTDANGAAVAAFTPLHGGTYRAVADAVRCQRQ